MIERDKSHVFRFGIYFFVQKVFIKHKENDSYYQILLTNILKHFIIQMLMIIVINNKSSIYTKGVKVMALVMLNKGEKGIISNLRTKEDVKKHLQSLGFLPGTEVEVLGENSSGMIFLIKGVKVALNRGLASQIHVQ